MKYIISILFVYFLTVNLSAQTIVNGLILDSLSKKPIAFANIYINNEKALNVISDIDGRFQLKKTSKSIFVICEHINYFKSDSIPIEKSDELIIYLQPLKNILEVVFLNVTNNPANRIIKKVIENKTLNNPENLSTFQYQSYNKIIYDIIPNKINKIDSVKFAKFLKGSPIFLTESVSIKTYLRPNKTDEVIIASKASGFRNPRFASLETDMQPFSFYKDNIKLLEKHYLNPISKGGLNKYSFRLEDQIPSDKDTIFIISYKPKNNKNIDGLKGLLYINSNQYAIQNVTATPFEESSLSLKIQQQYHLINDKYWFPEKLNYELIFGKDNNSPNPGISINGKSYIVNVTINNTLYSADYNNSITMKENAGFRNDKFWKNNRMIELNNNEVYAYKKIDSLGLKNNFDALANILEKGIQLKYPTKYFDFDLKKSLIYNNKESYRLGFGILTNDVFASRWTFGSNVGYGLKDKTIKYNATTYFKIFAEKKIFIGYEHNNDLIENGLIDKNLGQNIFNLRDYIGYNYNKIIADKFSFTFDEINNFKFNLNYKRTKISNLDAVDISIPSFVNTVLTSEIRFAYNEKTISAFGSDLTQDSHYPILHVNFSKGFKNLFGGSVNYEKVQMSLQQTFFSKNFGQTHYYIEGGFITKSTPQEIIFTGDGSKINNTFFSLYIPNNFQTMGLYEFYSDKYLNVFLNHDIGSLLFKYKKFKPTFVFHNNLGWGNLSKNKNLLLKTKDNIYLESGIEINNLIKLKINNYGFLGFGFSSFYRYGYYSMYKFSDNAVFRLTAKYSIN